MSCGGNCPDVIVVGSIAFANPTAEVGLTPVNGVAATAMRSDAAPPIDEGIAPTWTGSHIFAYPPSLDSVPLIYKSGPDISFDSAGNGSPEGVVSAFIGSTFRQWDGAPGATWWVKESNSGGNTGWTPMTAGTGSVANPTASIGLAAVNGVAVTAMRSDGAPPLDQSISPTWTGDHVFFGKVQRSLRDNSTYASVLCQLGATSPGPAGIGTLSEFINANSVGIEDTFRLRMCGRFEVTGAPKQINVTFGGLAAYQSPLIDVVGQFCYDIEIIRVNAAVPNTCYVGSSLTANDRLLIADAGGVFLNIDWTVMNNLLITGNPFNSVKYEFRRFDYGRSNT